MGFLTCSHAGALHAGAWACVQAGWVRADKVVMSGLDCAQAGHARALAEERARGASAAGRAAEQLAAVQARLSAEIQALWHRAHRPHGEV